MSPQWRDEIGILFAPRRLVLARVSRGLRPRRVGERFTDIATGHFANWEPALEALREQLAEKPWQNAGVRVVLADQWVRYMIVPWQASLYGDAERMVHARHLLAGMYGDMDDWTPTLSEAMPGRAQVATALPSALLAGLMTAIESSGGRLISLQPQLITAFNRASPQLPGTGCWFVSVDEGSLAAAHVTPNGWDRVHAVRIGNDWSAELRRLRLFGRIATGGTADERVFVCAPLWLRPAANDGDDGLEWLEEEQPAGGGTVAQLAWLQAHHV